ncbi:MAG: hypothetical protein HYS40_09340 [Gemmatimonadetes bacterium]|nr:hypothetical protein [Gemmatimonadota bacterium]
MSDLRGLLRRRSTLLLLVALGTLGALGVPGRLAAQVTRDGLIRDAAKAYQNFETARALELLNAALDPGRGPPDSVWGYGLQLLAQILIEDGQAGSARAWLRWAFRFAPELKIDTLTFVPEVVAAARVARDAVRGIPGDQVTETSWRWPARPTGDTLGQLQIKTSALPVPINVLVPGRGLVRSGETLVLPAGSYELQAAAEGYLTARVTREILPGVTTVLAFNLTRVGEVAQAPPVQAPPPQAAPPPAPPPAQPAPAQPQVQRRKGKFPVVIVLGVVGAAAAVALLAGGGGGGGGPNTGGITITFPNP